MNWPTTLVPYKRTDEFTHDTIPDGLKKAHTTQSGVWALIRVLEGELRFENVGEEAETLSAKAPGFIEPEKEHRIWADGDVRFYIEFYRDGSVAN